MNLAFQTLKKILPELNEKVVTPERMIQVFNERDITLHELPLEDAGCFVSKDGRDYVFLRQALNQVLYHETLLHEGVHALTSHPAPFLSRKHQLEADALSLVAMMPLSELPRLNRIKNSLDEETFILLERRNEVKERWSL